VKIAKTCACGAPKPPLTARKIARLAELRMHGIALCFCGHEIPPPTVRSVRQIAIIDHKLVHGACADPRARTRRGPFRMTR
jgi:hypothetical protein